MTVAVITGASRGLGLALATALAERGHDLVLDGRDAADLDAAVASLSGPGRRTAVRGDVADATHRAALAAAAGELGGAAVLVNNASTLGASPLPHLTELDPVTFEQILRVNVVAPLALIRELLPQLGRSAGRVVNISSDAGVEAYEAWGGYGASKAALDHLTRTLAAEHPELRAYAFDPGDMRTRMHQDAFPGEDISDRPDPSTVVPALLRLLGGDLPGGRYQASALAVDAVRA